MRSDEFIRISNAQLQYYLHIPDPDSLSDEDWARKLAELEYVRKLEKGNPQNG